MFSLKEPQEQLTQKNQKELICIDYPVDLYEIHEIDKPVCGTQDTLPASIWEQSLSASRVVSGLW